MYDLLAKIMKLEREGVKTLVAVRGCRRDILINKKNHFSLTYHASLNSPRGGEGELCHLSDLGVRNFNYTDFKSNNSYDF